jgi:Type II secretion system (T2SS), protein M subtype b
MIAPSWSQRDRRTLAIGGVTLGALLGVGRGLPAWREWGGAKRDVAFDALRQAAFATKGAKLLPALTESLALREQRLAEVDAMILRGATIPEAGASLAGVLSDYADDRAIRLVSVQVRPDSGAKDGFARVAVRATGVGDVAGITSLLQDIESGAPILAVRELVITQPDPAGLDGRAEALRFEMLIEGLASIGARKKIR